MISLVVTAHRREYLVESLLSVAAQNNKKFELVLCLDIRKDKELEAYCLPVFNLIKCQNKKIITLVGNGTAGFVRNSAFRNTTGEWICYLDGDDMLSPDAMDVMSGCISRYNYIDIFSSAMIRVDMNGICQIMEESLHYYPPISIYDVDPETIHEPTFFNQFQMMRRAVWENYHYDESTNGEDIDFMLINLLKWNFKKVPQYLYYYRDVNNSFSKKTYINGDFTTIRYQTGYYHSYFRKYYSDKFRGNFRNDNNK